MSFALIHGRRIVFSIIAVLAWLPSTFAEEKLSDAIHREPAGAAAVAQNGTNATASTSSPMPTAAVNPAANGAPTCVFDLTQKSSDHPLQPVLRVLKACQDEIDRNIQDYSCTLVKRERIDGELGESQYIFMKVRQQPFSVYMSFLKPYAGREVVYVAGQNSGKLVVLEAGFKRMLGKMNLDPEGTLAMSGQRYPITDVGIRNLTTKLTKMWQGETKFAECVVTSNPGTQINKRATTMIQVVHPVPRQEFRFHVARLFMDNELKIPIHFDAYGWPEQEGGEPPLDESYTYTSLKLNNGFTGRDFDPANNPDIFKK